MILQSIRWRVQAWHCLILVVVLSGFGVTAYHVARENQIRRLDQELEQRLAVLFRPQGGPQRERVEGRGERRGGNHHPDSTEFLAHLSKSVQDAGAIESSGPHSFYYALWEGDGKLLAQSPGAPANIPLPAQPAMDFGPSTTNSNSLAGPGIGPPGPPQPAVFRTRGEFRELLRYGPHGGDCLLVGCSLAPEQAAMRWLAWWLVAAGAAILLLGLAGGGWLAARAIRPIEDISATAMKIAAGDLSQRINAADSANELGRLADILNSTFSRLEAAFAHQSRFTADASHELRTPVSVILTQTQSALARERSGEEYREALEACQRAAQRMRKLTESLLALARLDAGQEPMKREPFDLSRVTRDSVEFVRPLAAERRIDIQCELQEVSCVGDAERIAQVATNLLTNAIHFNRDGGQVKVSVRGENGATCLRVTDTGEGIPAEDLPHVFERFYRVDQSRSRVPGRTGLGLAISKAILDAHSGTIEVTTQPGVGSEFTIRIPNGNH
jgi:heavy metal sensor kinase